MSVGYPPEAYLRVVFRMLRTEEGGRRKPVFSGYRPAFQIGRVGPLGQPEHNGAQLTFEPDTTVYPGDVAEGHLTPHFPAFWSEVSVGDSIGVFEGSKQVGAVEVVEIIPH